jgi:hyperosmotically inducible protein
MLRLLARGFAMVAIAWALTACQAMTGETVGQNIDDTNLTAVVKTKLAEDKLSSLSRVSVTTTHGVVSLSGVVESAEAKQHAEQIARAVEGVNGVNNNLQIQSR